MSIFSPKFVCFFLVVVVSNPSSIFDSISRLKSRSIVRAVRPSVAAAMRASIFLLFSPCLSALYLDGAADSIVAVAADGELPGPRGGDGHAAVAAVAAAARGAAAAAAAAVKVAPDVDPDHVDLVLV